MPISPTILLFVSISSFALFVLLLKYLVLHASLLMIVFFRYLIMAVIEFWSIRKKLTLSFKVEHKLLLILMSFVHLGIYYCLLGSFSSLPLILAVAIYLTYPLLTPWILRIWMGRRFNYFFAFGSYLAVGAALLSFSDKLYLNNLLIVVAITGALFKAISFVGYQRLKLSESPLIIWLFKYFIGTSVAALLLIFSWTPISWQLLALIFLTCLLEPLYKTSFNKASHLAKPFRMMALFNLSIFLLGGLDFVLFNQLPPTKVLLCSTLIYLGIFFTFLQKSILPNCAYDL